MTLEHFIGIRNALSEIIKGTEWEGHVYLVGGCVRDEIMKQDIHDIDIAINLPNGGIRFVCWLEEHNLTAKGRRPILFEHFGTAKVRLSMYPKDEIDCVQTRKEKYVYEEVPNPEKYFGTIEEDAICRDLTINSLFRNISTNELLDPTGKGLSDIEHNIIRTPNDPDISLRDNAMHILRCIRFAVKYDWAVSDELLESMKRNIDIIGEATDYRMTNEMIAFLKLKRRKRAIALLSKVGAMQIVEPYIHLILEKWNRRAERIKKKEERLQNKGKGDKKKEEEKDAKRIAKKEKKKGKRKYKKKRIVKSELIAKK